MSYETPNLVNHFSDLPDPRIDRTKHHNLIDIVFISICGVICGAKSFTEIELFGNLREEWFKKYLQLPNGIPSHDTFGRVWAMIDPKEFQQRFIQWVNELKTKLSEEEVIAIDGKTQRRSFDTKEKRSAIHIVSAWATKNHLVLGQQKTADKSNEITAIPELLDILAIKETVVSIDAMGCQKAIAEKIIEKEGNYLLAVKGNQETLHTEISTCFNTIAENNFSTSEVSHFKSSDSGHGRIENREYYVFKDISWLNCKDQWPGIATVGIACSFRESKGKESNDVRFYIMSKHLDAKHFASAVRSHWGIENSLHWVLDVVFREDDCRIRKDNAPANMNALRHIAVNLLRKDKTLKLGIAAKQLAAAINVEYLEKILA